MAVTRRAFALGFSGAVLGGGCSREEALISAAGTAFGTEITITLPESVEAGTFEQAFAEIERLEAIFTLFDPGSALRRLNDSGELTSPPPELFEVLEISDRVHRATGGAFDPTVQPLWELYERHFAENPTDSKGPDTMAIETARSRIGWDKVAFKAAEIRFREAGMALTLNGIAPGFVADRTVDLLEKLGVRHALVNTGEFRALGSRPDGSAWRVDISAGDGVVGNADLDGNALATSAGYATAFDLEQRFHHLFHPGRDAFQPAMRTIAVEAPRAALADALATAGGVMESGSFTNATSKIPGVRSRIFESRS